MKVGQSLGFKVGYLGRVPWLGNKVGYKCFLPRLGLDAESHGWVPSLSPYIGSQGLGPRVLGVGPKVWYQVWVP